MCLVNLEAWQEPENSVKHVEKTVKNLFKTIKKK